MPETCCVDCTNDALGETLDDCCVQGSLGFVELYRISLFLTSIFHDRRL
jgi:hypothetical protein